MFESSRLCIEHAKRRNEEIDSVLLAWLKTGPCAEVIEPYGDGSQEIRKMKLVKPIPASFSLITFEALHALRMALDHAGYAVSGNSRNAHFPFGSSLTDVLTRTRHEERGRSRDIPKELFDAMVSFQPYTGGDDFLCAMNKLCNSHKHEIISLPGMSITGVQARGESAAGIRIIGAPVWDRLKNEIELIICPRNAKLDYEFKFQGGITFADTEIETLEGRTVGAVFNVLYTKVEQIINKLEAECLRLGITK